MPDNLTPETRSLADNELAEVFAILRIQDAVLGLRIIDRLEATIKADRKRLEALDLVHLRARQFVSQSRSVRWKPGPQLGEAPSSLDAAFLALEAALAAGEETPDGNV